MNDFIPPSTQPASSPAQLTNMRLAMSTLLSCERAVEGLPRMALFYGPSGYGKSVAAAYVAAHFDAAYVEATPISTVRSLLDQFAIELGIARRERTAPRLLSQVIDHLVYQPTPLVIDEMDHLVRGNLVEVIRTIHDKARAPIMMVGEESLPAKLKAWERFDNRLLVSTAAQPSNLQDALLLRDRYCTQIKVADDLVAAILHATKGVTRRIVINLENAQTAALDEGVDTIDCRIWGKRRFSTDALPTRRAA